MTHLCFQCSKLHKKIDLIIDENNKYKPFIYILQKYNIYDISILEEELKNVIIYNKKDDENDKIKYNSSLNKNNVYNINNDRNVNNIVNKINLMYETLNKRKSKIIYNYYDLYNEYLKEKQKNIKLKFNEFICYRADNVKRYNEKVKRSYMLFNDLLNIVKDIKDYGKKERGKEITIVNILGKCRLSIDKIYKLRNNNYNKLIKFLKPIIINECKNDYNEKCFHF